MQPFSRGRRPLSRAVLGTLLLALVATAAWTAPATSSANAGTDLRAGMAPSYRVRDLIKGSGLHYRGETYSALKLPGRAGDQRPDLLIGFHGQGAALYRQIDRRRYEQLAFGLPSDDAASGDTLDRHDCAAGHFDRRKGLPDIFCSIGRTGHNWVKHAGIDNELWLQHMIGEFHDVGTDWGIGDRYGRGRGGLVLDANHDGWDDLYVINEITRKGDPYRFRFRTANKLFLNKGGVRLPPRQAVGSQPPLREWALFPTARQERRRP